MRVVQVEPQRHINNRWACVFQSFVTVRGAELMSSEMKSAPVWDTATAAEMGGKRALAILAETKMFPNMCEIW